MAVIDRSRLSGGRDYLAGPEVGLMLQRVGNKFFKLLWRKEFVQHDAPRPRDLWRIQNAHFSRRLMPSFVTVTGWKPCGPLGGWGPLGGCGPFGKPTGDDGGCGPLGGWGPIGRFTDGGCGPFGKPAGDDGGWGPLGGCGPVGRFAPGGCGTL